MSKGWKAVTEGRAWQDHKDLSDFAGYEVAIVSRKQLTWSQGRHDLRKGAQLGKEKSDEEMADEELQGVDVAVLPRESWRVVEVHATELSSVTETGCTDPLYSRGPGRPGAATGIPTAWATSNIRRSYVISTSRLSPSACALATWRASSVWTP